MDLDCSTCGTTISYIGSPPKFCQECGTPVGSTISIGGSADAANTVDQTIAPSALPPVKAGLNAEAPGKIGSFQLVEILGSGGMGVVWEAIDEKTGRRVALKRLGRNHLSDEKSVQRFYREAQLASKISHSRVTFVYGVGEVDGQPHIAMELMPGETLSDRVKQNGPLAVGEAVDKILDVIDGLIAAHDLGLIHRDVKPSNCFIDVDDRVKIGDFGLSKSVVNDDVNLTRTGTFMGTPAYASPEQIRGATLDERTDIYAVGATLCFLLTGRAPFTGDAMSVTAQIISDTCKIEEDIPKPLKSIIYRTLEKKAESRHLTLNELRNALLPFAGSHNSAAEFGRRVSAFMIDMCGLYMITGFVNATLGGWAGSKARIENVSVDEFLESIGILAAIAAFAVPLVYFFLTESVFGKSFGKQIVGLKVVDMDGGRPAWYRILFRSFMMPGGAAVPLVLGLLVTAFWHVHMDPLELTLQGVLNSLILLVPLCIIGSPLLRISEGRGFHETLSGTHVIMERRLPGRQLILTDMSPFEAGVLRAGCYEVGQAIYDSPEHQIYRGFDSNLQREVWILAKPGDAPSAARIELSRVVRPHWLDGGYFDSGERWDAYEAIEGLPISMVLEKAKNPLDWPEVRLALEQLAVELKSAVNDGTLPETLSSSQLWMDKSCHAKLIDVPLAAEAARDAMTIFADSDPMKRAVEFFQSVTGRINEKLVLPVASSEFLASLKTMPATADTLNWAIEQLQPMRDKVGALTWETRWGILGLTLALEYIAYTSIASCIFVLLYFGIKIPVWAAFPTGALIGLSVPIVVGALYGGGIVFHLLGIAVTDRSGKVVSKTKLAIRSAWAWLPAVASSGLWVFFPLMSKIQGPGNTPEPGSMAEFMKDSPVFVLVILAGSLAFSLLMTAGAAISIWKAKRGLQDYLAGTRLLPK